MSPDDLCAIKQSKAKQSKAKQSKAKQSKAKQSKAKQSKAKQSKAKQSKAKQSKAKQSKAKQSKAKQMIVPTVLCGRAVGIFHARNGEREGKPTRRTWSFEAISNRLNAEHLFCFVRSTRRLQTPLQEGERSRRGEGRAAGMRREP
ncbi:hypothetical protein [Stutzerimonas chloritidismutans]